MNEDTALNNHFEGKQSAEVLSEDVCEVINKLVAHVKLNY